VVLKFILSNFGNFYKKYYLASHLKLQKIKVLGLQKVAPGRVTEGDVRLVR